MGETWGQSSRRPAGMSIGDQHAGATLLLCLSPIPLLHLRNGGLPDVCANQTIILDRLLEGL